MRHSSLSPIHSERGPFEAHQIRPGDPYELSDGHPVVCEPAGGDGAGAAACGAEAINSDPAVQRAAVEAGFNLRPGTLRAPDIAVGEIPDAPGWVKGKPALAVEYASVDQDEKSLQQKIADLLAAGTQQIWVVRLLGPRRVEVYRPGQPVELRKPGDLLTAEGVLQNPVPVEALYSPEAAHEHALRNLLQRKGYASLEEIRAEARNEGKAEGRAEGKAEGRLEGKAETLRRVMAARGLSIDPAGEQRLASCTDPALLDRWISRAAVASTPGEVFRT